MKKLFGCLLFIIYVMTAGGQQVYFGTGLVISSFDYENSAGDQITDLKGNYSGGLELGFRMRLMESGLHLSLAATHNKYNATSSDPVLGNFNDWNVAYVGANLLADYELFTPMVHNSERLTLFLKGGVSADFLITGKQRMNSQVYDLHGVEEFDKPVYFVKAGLGANYYLSGKYLVFGQYMFGNSILIGNYSGQEQLKYLTHSIIFGVAMDLFATKKR